MRENGIPDDATVQLNGGDRFRQTRMAGIDVSLPQLLRSQAGGAVTGTAGFPPCTRRPDVGTKFGRNERILGNGIEFIVKDGNADADSRVKIFEHFLQFLSIETSDHIDPFKIRTLCKPFPHVQPPPRCCFDSAPTPSARPRRAYLPLPAAIPFPPRICIAKRILAKHRPSLFPSIIPQSENFCTFSAHKNRINIHRHSRWFFSFGLLALILPAARKPRL